MSEATPYQRRQLILKMFKEDNILKTSHLAETLSVSTMTLWRDLNILEDEGIIKREHGAIILNENSRHCEEPPYLRRFKKNQHLKTTIARYTAKEFVRNNMNIAIDGSTTTIEIIHHIREEEVTLLSHALYALQAGSYNPKLNIIGSGGVLRYPSFTFMGDEVDRFIDTYSIDIAFFSAEAFDFEKGVMDPNPIETSVKKRLMEKSRQSVLCIDSTKIDSTSLIQFAKVSDFDAVIIDDGVTPEQRERLERLGDRVLFCQEESCQ